MRLLVVFVCTSMAWGCIRVYYQAAVLFCTAHVGYLLTQLPLGQVGMDADGTLRIGLGATVLRPFHSWTGYVAMTPVCLLLSTSDIAFMDRIKALFIGMAVVFASEVSGLLIHFHSCFHDDAVSVDAGKTVGMVANTTGMGWIFPHLEHYMQRVMKPLVAICVWIALVRYYKRSMGGTFVEKLL